MKIDDTEFILLNGEYEGQVKIMRSCEVAVTVGHTCRVEIQEMECQIYLPIAHIREFVEKLDTSHRGDILLG